MYAQAPALYRLFPALRAALRAFKAELQVELAAPRAPQWDAPAHWLQKP